MKKYFRVFLFIFIFLFLSINVLAESFKDTTLNDLQTKAQNIKVNYEIVETKTPVEKTDHQNEFETTIELPDYYIKESIRVTVYNLTNDLLIEQTDDKSNTKKTIYYSDTVNGNYSFETDNIEDLVNYTFKIYSNVNSCDRTLVKTINYIKPKKNSYTSFQICINNPDVPVCEAYITKDLGITEDMLIDTVNKYLSNSQNSNVTTKIINKKDNKTFWKNYGLYFIISGGIVLAGGVTYIIVSKKRSAL